MNTAEIKIDRVQMHKLLASASPDAALLYLFLHSGNDISQAQSALRLSEARISCAAATLRQLGLWQPEKQARLLAGERPSYCERDVVNALESDGDFRALYGEIQRLLGRSLNTEELKIIMGFVRYLGLPGDVICILICYCKDRARQKGSTRNPSLRTVEKEAYAWAELGIDTLEEAAAYIQRQNLRNTRIAKLMRILQIHGRSLTPGEEKYAGAWLELGFDEQAIAMAYERTCLNTGGLNWAYMNKILMRWNEAGLHTAEAISAGERKKDVPRGASGQLGQAELEAIQSILQEE